MVPNVAEHYRKMVGRLDESLNRDVERARAALQDVIGSSVTLQPDESGQYLWAEFGLETAPLVSAASGSELMVAGVGFEPTTFGL